MIWGAATEPAVMFALLNLQYKRENTFVDILPPICLNQSMHKSEVGYRKYELKNATILPICVF